LTEAGCTDKRPIRFRDFEAPRRHPAASPDDAA
jgi:hypothetical protein